MSLSQALNQFAQNLGRYRIEIENVIYKIVIQIIIHYNQNCQ